MERWKILDELKKISAEIGKAELMRIRGEYYPISKLIKLKKQFRNYSKLLKEVRK